MLQFQPPKSELQRRQRLLSSAGEYAAATTAQLEDEKQQQETGIKHRFEALELLIRPLQLRWISAIVGALLPLPPLAGDAMRPATPDFPSPMLRLRPCDTAPSRSNVAIGIAPFAAGDTLEVLPLPPLVVPPDSCARLFGGGFDFARVVDLGADFNRLTSSVSLHHAWWKRIPARTWWHPPRKTGPNLATPSNAKAGVYACYRFMYISLGRPLLPCPIRCLVVPTPLPRR